MSESNHCYAVRPRFRQRIAFFISFLITLICAVGLAPVQAIENGTVAIGEPVVGLFYQGDRGIFCSAAVVEPRIVITAHHCIPNAGVDTDYYLNKKIMVSQPGKAITFEVSNQAQVIGIISNKERWTLGLCANGFCDDLNDVAILILDRDYPVPANLKIASLDDVQRFRAIDAPVVTYGYGLISFGKSASGTPYKLNANLQAPNQGGYGIDAFNVSVKGDQNVCGGDSGGPTYVLDGDSIYYLGPTAASRRPSCIQKPITDNGFFGGTFLAAKSKLLIEAQEKVIQIKDEERKASELKLKQEAEAKAAAELKAKQEAEAKVAAELKAKQEAEAKVAAELKAKQEADAKAAAADKAALTKAEAELVAANAALADSQKVNREQASRISAFEEQFRALSESVNTFQTQVSQLDAKLSTALKSLNTANTKIKKICSVKPKPKGC